MNLFHTKSFVKLFFFWFFKWISSNFQNNRLFFFCSFFARYSQIITIQIKLIVHKLAQIITRQKYRLFYVFTFFRFFLFYFLFFTSFNVLLITCCTNAEIYNKHTRTHQTIDQTFSIVINHLMVRLHQAMSITYILKHCCTRKAHKMQFNSTKSIHWIQFQLGIHFCRFSHCTSKIHIYF